MLSGAGFWILEVSLLAILFFVILFRMTEGEIYVSMAKGNIKNWNTFPSLSKVPRKKMDKKPIVTFVTCLGCTILIYIIWKCIPFLGSIGYILVCIGFALTLYSGITLWIEYLTVRYYIDHPDQYEQDLVLYERES